MDLADVKGSYRLWTLPILRALSKLGGKAPPLQIEAAIRQIAPDALTDLQWARIIKGKYVRWAGSELKKAGLVGGSGSWELTASGRALVEKHASAPLEFPKIAPLDPVEAGKLHAPLETLPATDFAAYAIPRPSRTLNAISRFENVRRREDV